MVVIGVPTYNRSGLLRRCVESALAQTHGNVRVVISDNASTDGTPAVCEELARKDPRVSYFRHPANIGATANFNAVFQRAEGELCMWLADDDWLACDYVQRCVDVLRASPEVVAACGLARYDSDGRQWSGDALQCTSGSVIARVLGYYRQVQDNGIFYGVLRRAAARDLVLRSCIGGDWLLVAALAARGHLRTLEGTALYREPGGNSANRRKLATALGLPAWQGVVPVTFTLAVNAAQDVLRRDGPHAQVNWPTRLVLAALLPCWIVAIKPWQEIARRWRKRRERPSVESAA